MEEDNFNKPNSKVKNLKIRNKVLILLATTSVVLTSFLIKNQNKSTINTELPDNKEKTSISNLISFSHPAISSFQEVTGSSLILDEEQNNLDLSVEKNNKEDLVISDDNKENDQNIEDSEYEYEANSTINEEPNEVEKEVIDKNLEYSLENTDLITYKYDGEIFYIIDTSKGYNHLKRQQKDKCWQCAHAYASDIFRFSDSENLTGSTIGLTSCDISEILEIAASELINDRPTVIEVNGKPNTNLRHFVTIVGIRKKCDFNNLQQSDFLVLDPAKAKLIRLDTTLSGKDIERYLINAQDATYRPPGGEDNQYCIEIYNNPDEYLSDTCKRTKV